MLIVSFTTGLQDFLKMIKQLKAPLYFIANCDSLQHLRVFVTLSFFLILILRVPASFSKVADHEPKDVGTVFNYKVQLKVIIMGPTAFF